MKLNEIEKLGKTSLWNYPVSLVGYVTVCSNFSYISDNLDDTKSEFHVLVNQPELCSWIMNNGEVPPLGGSMVLFRERCRITGSLSTTSIAPFKYALTELSEVELFVDGNTVKIEKKVTQQETSGSA